MKALVDSHLHSFFSGDCEMEPELVIKKALEIGLEGIVFTDHMDIDYPTFDINFSIDLENYSKFYDELKIKHRNNIKILKGLEVGLQEHVAKDNQESIEKYDFDFIIGSIHVVDKLDLHNGDYTKNKTQKQAYERFLEQTYVNLLAYDNYDILGHLDSIRRYGVFENNFLRFNDYQEYIDTILKHIIKKNKGIEVNTSGFRYNLNSTSPGYDIIKRYKALGGKIITLGSDAHNYDFIGNDFPLVVDMLKEIGFNSVAYFEKREPTFIKI